MTLPLTAALLGTLFAGSILLLVRLGHLHGGQAAWWLFAASVALLLGIFPQWVDRVGAALGVSYPPILLLVLAVLATLIKLLVTDIELARKERRLRRLTQKLALMEYEFGHSQQADSQEPPLEGRPRQPRTPPARREAG
ncbi:DUF2304 domain-containing protein [Pseudomarimonas salicorniae]|uniref:DUF2304 domain-containing protein n=1 Tax=Pseudomarimonas salicorniae TaxID=2933270 RepID=A0ABT0GH23_9GAMM|nr:DUF2304 domain-containing protein [Lysobacter sp. CAU 1642]MCK7593828.1 DUF2304 domain-containing protein [Lysobacter sp. CAU 1642]